MLLDQQFPMERAFASPALLTERLGGPLTAAGIAEYDTEALVAAFTGPPALHRYPRSMAERVQALCRTIVADWGGEVERLWTDADGSYLGKYRKNHIPHTSGFWEKYFFKPGNLGYPVFQTRYAKVGVYICYDRHFPEGARILGLNGAEIVFNPSATVAGLSQYLWKLEQPAHAVANGYFMGCSNRVGTEAPWGIGKFYGSSYFVDPRGQFLAEASEDSDELVTATMDLEQIEEVRRVWQFYRDRRPESYEEMVELLP
jgi:predicted amidohydrolase